MMNRELHDALAMLRRIEKLEERVVALEALLVKHMLTHGKQAVELPLVGEVE